MPKSKQKKQITINLNADIVEYFKKQAECSGIPYQTLINLYLTDCVVNKRELLNTLIQNYYKDIKQLLTLIANNKKSLLP